MSNTAVPVSAEPEVDDFSESPDMERLRWEKGVEFALANELQAWHIEAGIEGFACSSTIRKKVSALARDRRYVPLAGKVESELADAFAVNSNFRLMLIECKHTLSIGEWEREAKGPQPVDGDNAKVRNKGGKNRLEQLLPLQQQGEFYLRGTKCSYKSLAADCHFLVGMRPKESTLGVIDYWDFIFNKDHAKKLPAIGDLTELKKHGRLRADFLYYVAALLNQTDQVGDKDIGWVGEQVIVLAHDPNKPEIGMRGFPVSREQLSAFCNLQPPAQIVEQPQPAGPSKGPV